MRHGHLDEGEPELSRATHHLGIDEETARLRQQLSQHFATEDLERAIDVVKSRAEQCTRKPVVAPREESPAPGVFSVGPIARDDRVLGRERGELAEIEQVELAIGIGKRDQVEPRGFEAGARAAPYPRFVPCGSRRVFYARSQAPTSLAVSSVLPSSITRISK